MFGESLNYQDLSQMLEQGAEMKTTLLSEEFTFEQFQNQIDAKRIPLFAIDTNHHVQVFTAEPDFQPKAGWKIMSLAEKVPVEAE